MRFAVPDSDEEDTLYERYSSDSSDDAAAHSSRTKTRSTTRASISRAVRRFAEHSDSEEDEAREARNTVAGQEGGGDSSDDADYAEAREQAQETQPGGYREKRAKSVRLISSPYKRTSSPASSNGTVTQRPRARSRISAMLDVVDEAPTGYDAWLSISQSSVWKEGHKIAHSRRAHLREVALNARDEAKAKQDARAAEEAESMRQLLEGMSIKVAQEEEAARQVFKEREKKLWEDIDAAIRRAESLAAEQASVRAMQERQRLDAERLAAEKVAKEAAEAKAAAAAAAKKEAEEKQAAAVEAARLQAEEQAAAATREAEEKAQREQGQTGDQWNKWVGVQKWMKSKVIEPVKADGETKRGLRGLMRGVTRGLGQVVNTRESILRVTTEMHDALLSLLPSPPSPAHPATLTEHLNSPDSPAPLPLSYLYLLSHTSKGLIRQAAAEVSAKQDAAFPLARIVLGLMLRGHAALGEVLMARLVKKCPLVVPFYPTRQQGQSREEFDKSLGRALDETPSEYVNRTTGIAALYFSILTVPLHSFVSPPSSLSPSPTPTPLQLPALICPAMRLPAAWSWLAQALKSPIPSLLPAAQLLTTWVEICASDIAQTYGQKHLDKVMRAIQREGVGEMGEDGKFRGTVKGDSTAAVQRLGAVVGEWQKKGAPAGRDWK